jgi:hypothetical protein
MFEIKLGEGDYLQKVKTIIYWVYWVVTINSYLKMKSY